MISKQIQYLWVEKLAHYSLSVDKINDLLRKWMKHYLLLNFTNNSICYWVDNKLTYMYLNQDFAVAPYMIAVKVHCP